MGSDEVTCHVAKAWERQGLGGLAGKVIREPITYVVRWKILQQGVPHSVWEAARSATPCGWRAIGREGPGPAQTTKPSGLHKLEPKISPRARSSSGIMLDLSTREKPRIYTGTDIVTVASVA